MLVHLTGRPAPRKLSRCRSFSPFFHAVVYRDSVVFTDGLQGTLTFLGPEGGPGRVLTISMPAVDADAARSESIPRIARVLVDGSGRFRLKRYEPRTDSRMLGGWAGARGGEWSVVDADGAAVADITLPDDFMPPDVADGRIAGFARDDLGVERVTVFSFGGRP